MKKKRVNKTKLYATVVLRYGFAVLIGLMAALQLAKFGDFIDVLKTYHVFPENYIAILGLLIVGMELVASFLLMDPKKRIDEEGAFVGLMVACVWVGFVSQALIRNISMSNAGLFGSYAQQGVSMLVLLECAGLALLAFLTFHLCRD